MRNDWIIDVLADLRTFALSNDLPLLAEQLDDTALVALAEIDALQERTQDQTDGKQTCGGSNFGGAGAGGVA